MHQLDLLRLFWGLGFILYLNLTLNVALLCRFVWTKQTEGEASRSISGIKVAWNS